MEPGAPYAAMAWGDTVRLWAFLSVLAAMMLWELAAPWRRAEMPQMIRWTNNLGLVVLDAAVVRLVFPVLAVGAAAWAGARGMGVLNAVPLPGWAAVAVAFVALDLAIWVQHRVFHAVPALWRLHRMHHADPEVDATTGLRFHPAEILLSMAIKMAAVVALGAPPLAVVMFEIALNATSIFSHANIVLPGWADRALGRIVVTPGMHRIHHSVRRDETDSNFGFNLSVWDRLFGTYRAQTAGALVTGQPAFRSARDQRIDRLLLQPLRKDCG